MLLNGNTAVGNICKKTGTHTLKILIWGAGGFGFYFKNSDLLLKVHFCFKHAFEWEACTVFYMKKTQFDRLLRAHSAQSCPCGWHFSGRAVRAPQGLGVCAQERHESHSARGFPNDLTEPGGSSVRLCNNTHTQTHKQHTNNTHKRHTNNTHKHTSTQTSSSSRSICTHLCLPAGPSPGVL